MQLLTVAYCWEHLFDCSNCSWLCNSWYCLLAQVWGDAQRMCPTVANHSQREGYRVPTINVNGSWNNINVGIARQQRPLSCLPSPLLSQYALTIGAWPPINALRSLHNVHTSQCLSECACVYAYYLHFCVHATRCVFVCVCVDAIHCLFSQGNAI